jgi:hypothetical protein
LAAHGAAWPEPQSNCLRVRQLIPDRTSSRSIDGGASPIGCGAKARSALLDVRGVGIGAILPPAWQGSPSSRYSRLAAPTFAIARLAPASRQDRAEPRDAYALGSPAIAAVLAFSRALRAGA